MILDMGTKQPKSFDIELVPNAWQRFERAVDVVAKSPPQHRIKKRKQRASASKAAQKKRKS
jgi:hypothetical protein